MGGGSLGEGWRVPLEVHTQKGIHLAKFTITQGVALAFPTLKLILTFQRRTEDLSLRGAITLITLTDCSNVSQSEEDSFTQQNIVTPLPNTLCDS